MQQKTQMLCSRLQMLLAHEEGQDLVEYALVIALIALGATAGMGSLASNISSAFASIGSTLAGAV